MSILGWPNPIFAEPYRSELFEGTTSTRLKVINDLEKLEREQRWFEGQKAERKKSRWKAFYTTRAILTIGTYLFVLPLWFWAGVVGLGVSETVLATGLSVVALAGVGMIGWSDDHNDGLYLFRILRNWSFERIDFDEWYSTHVLKDGTETPQQKYKRLKKEATKRQERIAFLKMLTEDPTLMADYVKAMEELE